MLTRTCDRHYQSVIHLSQCLNYKPGYSTGCILLYPFEIFPHRLKPWRYILLQTVDPKIQNLFATFVYDAFQTKTSHVAPQNRWNTASSVIYIMCTLAYVSYHSYVWLDSRACTHVSDLWDICWNLIPPLNPLYIHSYLILLFYIFFGHKMSVVYND